jgi:aryl-alcohol dehydrogenase-like predicted oxidoreductase
MPKPTCPTHGIPLVSYCPACRGTTGGKATSEAKRAASAKNVEKARETKASKRPP